MKKMCAKEFAKSRGLPLKTIRRLCRNMILPHTQIGRVYYIDAAAAAADAYLERLERKKCEPVPKVRRKSAKSGFNFEQELQRFCKQFIRT